MKPMLKALAIATAMVASGAVSASTFVFQATLDGPSEAPPNASPGTGFTTVTIDDVAKTMRVEANFSGLLGNTTASHIHCCTAVPGVSTAGVATVTPTFTDFPSGVKSGSYDHTFDLTLTTGTFNTSFVTANGGTAASATAALAAGLNAGKAYFNIHTSTFGGGEIRGFLAPVPVPAAVWLLGSALGGLIARRRVAA